MKSFDAWDQVMQLSIESSYKILPPELQQFLIMVSIFPSTFDIHAASLIYDISSTDCKSILRKLIGKNKNNERK